MRITVIHKPTMACIDGIRLDVFEVGHYYDVGSLLGAVMLAEGWAAPAADVARRRGRRNVTAGDDKSLHPSNLIRERYPPVSDSPATAARDRGASRTPERRRRR